MTDAEINAMADACLRGHFKKYGPSGGHDDQLQDDIECALRDAYRNGVEDSIEAVEHFDDVGRGTIAWDDSVGLMLAEIISRMRSMLTDPEAKP